MDLRTVTDKDLFEEFTRRMRCSSKPKKRVLFVGPPGGGKGTQTPKLVDEYCWCALATGDMLREAVSKGTDLGKKAKGIMAKGDLVPDDLIVGLIKDKITSQECRFGFVLDGFPRTLNQAHKLDELLQADNAKLDKVFEFKIKDELLTERITGRRIHKKSGRSYHLKFNPPKVEGKDDITGEDLMQRKDDTADVLVNRLAQYHSMTKPIIGHYQKTGKVVTLDAEKGINDIWSQIKGSM